MLAEKLKKATNLQIPTLCVHFPTCYVIDAFPNGTKSGTKQPDILKFQGLILKFRMFKDSGLLTQDSNARIT